MPTATVVVAMSRTKLSSFDVPGAHRLKGFVPKTGFNIKKLIRFSGFLFIQWLTDLARVGHIKGDVFVPEKPIMFWSSALFGYQLAKP